MIQRAALKIQHEVAYDEINSNVQRDGGPDKPSQ